MTGCNFGKEDIYYILTVWQIEGGKPFDISRSSGVICRAGMWNSVGFDIRGGEKRSLSECRNRDSAACGA